MASKPIKTVVQGDVFALQERVFGRLQTVHREVASIHMVPRTGMFRVVYRDGNHDIFDPETTVEVV